MSKQLLILFLLLSLSTLSWAQGTGTFGDEALENYLQKNQLKEAETYLTQQLAKESSLNAEQKSYYFNRKSQIELQKGLFTSSLAFAKKSEVLLGSSPNSKLWGETFRAICFAYIRLGKLDSALIYAEKLQDFSKKTNDPKLERAALVALGNISLQNLAYKESLEFYLAALQATKEAGDSINLKVDLYNVGLAYGRLNEKDKSNTYLLQAAVRAEKEQTWDLVARSYGSLADNYLSLKNYTQQEYYLLKANQIAEKLRNTQLLAMGYANLMESQLLRKQWDEAIASGNKSKEELKKRPVIQLEAKVDSLLYLAYKGKGEYKEALDQLVSYDKLRLEIRGDAQKEKLDQLTVQYEVEKKDLQIKNQESELEKEKAANRLLITGIVSVCLLGLLLGYLAIRNARTKRLLFQKEKELDLHFRTAKLEEKTKLPSLNFEPSQEESAADHQRLFQEIIEFIRTNKLYLDPKFNQQTLVTLFGTNRQYLYEAISKNGDDNFRGIINRFRINEAKRLLAEQLDSEHPLDVSAIAEKVGFNSYPTFYRAFKNITGLTPLDFTKELRKDKN